jgi:hypothetical protein
MAGLIALDKTETCFAILLDVSDITVPDGSLPNLDRNLEPSSGRLV